MQYLRNRSAPALNCWVIIHCLEVSCKEDQITSAQRDWFIFVQLTDEQWIITQQFTHWSWSISILTHNKRRKHIRSIQLLPTFRHWSEELPPILRLRRIHLHVIVMSFKRKNDVTPSNAMNDVYRRGVLEFLIKYRYLECSVFTFVQYIIHTGWYDPILTPHYVLVMQTVQMYMQTAMRECSSNFV